MDQKLYVNTFTLAFLIFVSIREVEPGKNWIITATNPILGMEYDIWFGINPTNQKLVNKLKANCEIIVYGTVKSNKNKDIVLRGKQIVVA